MKVNLSPRDCLVIRRATTQVKGVPHYGFEKIRRTFTDEEEDLMESKLSGKTIDLSPKDLKIAKACVNAVLEAFGESEMRIYMGNSRKEVSSVQKKLK